RGAMRKMSKKNMPLSILLSLWIGHAAPAASTRKISKIKCIEEVILNDPKTGITRIVYHKAPNHTSFDAYYLNGNRVVATHFWGEGDFQGTYYTLSSGATTFIEEENEEGFNYFRLLFKLN